MPPNLQQNKSQNYYEGKWDKIVMKMLRAEVARDPAVGADLAKGLNFYFHAAMEFAKHLEQEFQYGQGENERRIPSTHHMNSTISSAAKSASNVIAPHPVHVLKKQKSNNVSEKINEYEQKKGAKYFIEESNIENVPFFGSSSLSTTKRPSLQLDSTKIPKEIKTISIDSTPIDAGAKPLTDDWIEIVEPTLIETVEETIKHGHVITSDSKMTTSKASRDSITKIPENQSHISSLSTATKPYDRIAIDDVKEHRELKVEVFKPIPPVSEPPKIEPRFKPPPPRRERIGAICMDGWRSSSTGRGTCSHHGGVREWLYTEI
uniref:Uncharacterized protein n=1 Tax=Panagrolaimus superbus TaxID=310955 RepID=A0A914YX33_9BILA